jgi:hypothetical protein
MKMLRGQCAHFTRARTVLRSAGLETGRGPLILAASAARPATRYAASSDPQLETQVTGRACSCERQECRPYARLPNSVSTA